MNSSLNQELFETVSEFMRVVSYETEQYGAVPMLAYQFPLVANYRCSMVARTLADFINMNSDNDLRARTIVVEGIDPKYNHGYAHPSDRGKFFWHDWNIHQRHLLWMQVSKTVALRTRGTNVVVGSFMAV